MSLTKAPAIRSRVPFAEWALLVESASPDTNVTRLAELLNRQVNWADLLLLADEHGVLPLLNEKLSGLEQSPVPREVQQRFCEWKRAQTTFTLRMTAELFRLLENFEAAGIGTLAIKGPALAQRCYGDPAMRQYGDLDLIVRQRDIHRATEMMVRQLGYEPRVPLKTIVATKIPGEYVFRTPDSKLLIEFHTERTFRYHPRRLQIEKLFERQVRVEFDGREVPGLSAEDELTLICIHGAKHFWEQLLWIADVARLSCKPGVNPKRVLESAAEVGAERMLRVGLALAYTLLGANLHPELDADLQTDPAALRMAAKIRERLASVGSHHPIGIVERATFRMRMRGGFFQSAAYLIRLSLSPTEEDWGNDATTKRLWFLEAAGRPFRLARKYRRNPRN